MLVLDVEPRESRRQRSVKCCAAFRMPRRAERLAAKAREEGALTFYTSMATTESGPLAQAFEKKYGVKFNCGGR